MVQNRFVLIMILFLCVQSKAPFLKRFHSRNTDVEDQIMMRNRQLLLPSLFQDMRRSNMSRTIAIISEGGDSNKMIAIASTIALAALTGRNPIIKWHNLFLGNRFGSHPPLEIESSNKTIRPRSSECFIGFDHRGTTTSCWTKLLNYTNDLSFSGWPLYLLYSECKTLYVHSNQNYLPVLLQYKLHGKTLLSRLSQYSVEPMVALVTAIFIPPHLYSHSLSQYYHHIMQEEEFVPVHSIDRSKRRHQNIFTKKSSNNTYAKKRLLSIHLRNVMLSSYIKKRNSQIETIHTEIVTCVVETISTYNITHVYIASESPPTQWIEMIQARLDNSSFNDQSDQTIPFLNFSTLNDFHHSHFHEQPPLQFPDLADSMMLGQGSVCMGTVGSTFSMIARHWWAGQNCEVVIDVPTCQSQRRRQFQQLSSSSSSSSPQTSLKLNDSQNAALKQHSQYGMIGITASDVYDCDAWSCPNLNVTSQKYQVLCDPLHPLKDTLTINRQSRHRAKTKVIMIHCCRPPH